MVSTRLLLVAASALALAACEDPWAAEDLSAVGAPVVFTAVDAGMESSCGLDAAGKAWCWGTAAGTDSPRLMCQGPFDPLYGVAPDPLPCWDRPVPVADDHRFVALSIADGGAVTYAIDTDGALWGWGFLWNGETSGTYVHRWTSHPERVPGTEKWRFRTVDASNTTACGITTGGAIICWGEPNMVTTLGVPQCAAGPVNCFEPPVQVGTATNWVDVQVGTQSACALDDAAHAWCFGEGMYGQLGVVLPNACTSNGVGYRCTPDPTRVSATLAFASLSSDGGQVCGILTNGDLYCWGLDANNARIYTPTLRGTGFAKVNVFGEPGYCAVRTNGTVWCTGLFGASGTLLQIAVVGQMAGVGASSDHACAWNAAGSAWCWGEATYGQLGDGNVRVAYGPTPYQVAAPYRY